MQLTNNFSLRERIAVVPQDPILFRDSIMNNIRYAKLTATDKEVHEACKAAAVHDKIMTFPDGQWFRTLKVL
jgi:ABC-type multidrug transport system fused ATPase/permease subunit